MSVTVFWCGQEAIRMSPLLSLFMKNNDTITTYTTFHFCLFSFLTQYNWSDDIILASHYTHVFCRKETTFQFLHTLRVCEFSFSFLDQMNMFRSLSNFMEFKHKLKMKFRIKLFFIFVMKNILSLKIKSFILFDFILNGCSNRRHITDTGIHSACRNTCETRVCELKSIKTLDKNSHVTRNEEIKIHNLN